MAKVHAIRIHQTGGPEAMRWEEVEVGEPVPGQVRIRHKAVGLNYIDTYHRSGLYPLTLPSGIGLEGAGVVEAVGVGVSEFKPGDRAGYCSGPVGAYAEARLFPADRLIKLPAGIDDRTAAAMLHAGAGEYAAADHRPLACRKREGAEAARGAVEAGGAGCRADAAHPA